MVDAVATPDALHSVLEKCDGMDLFALLKLGQIGIDETREIIRQMLCALDAMHSSGRLHKDLKLKNVIASVGPKCNATSLEDYSPNLNADRLGIHVEIIDLDTVTEWRPDSPHCKEVLGTDGYIAHECYSGNVGPPSDIFAVGVVMYRLLTKKFPCSMDIFRQSRGDNYVGSPAMSRVGNLLKRQVFDFKISPLNLCQEAADLLKQMLSHDASCRPSASQALEHAFFDGPASPKSLSQQLYLPSSQPVSPGKLIFHTKSGACTPSDNIRRKRTTSDERSTSAMGSDGESTSSSKEHGNFCFK